MAEKIMEKKNKKVFDSFKGDLRKTMILGSISAVALVGISIVTLFLHLMKSNTFFTDNRDLFKTSPSEKEVCFVAAKLLNKGKLSKKFFSNSLIKRIKGSRNFDFRAEKIFRPDIFSEGKVCKVVTKDEIGLRAFEFKIKRNKDLPLGHIIEDIDEVVISQNLRRYANGYFCSGK